jgi:hypothetical protein
MKESAGVPSFSNDLDSPQPYFREIESTLILLTGLEITPTCNGEPCLLQDRTYPYKRNLTYAFDMRRLDESPSSFAGMLKA